MKGETSIVYHARFEAKVSPKLNCLDEHEARGLWIQIVDCYRPRPSPLPPTLIPRVFSIKLRDPAVPLTKLTIHKLTFLNNELNYIQSNRSPFFAPINGHFSFIIPHSTLSLILEEHLSLPFWNTTSASRANQLNESEWASKWSCFIHHVLISILSFVLSLALRCWREYRSEYRSIDFEIRYSLNKKKKLNSNYRKNDC